MIKFYSGVDITTEYKNTYRNIRAHLNKFPNFVLNDSNIYLRFNGKLQFNLNVPFLYAYANYIEETKLIDGANKYFYYIITKWEIVNNCLIIEYILDYFHTYYNSWDILRSCLRFSGKPDENRPHALPLEYELKNQSFGVILPNDLAKRTLPGLTDYVLVAEGYFYTLTDKGDNDISQFCGIVELGENKAHLPPFRATFSLSALRKAISSIVEYQNAKLPLPYRVTKFYLFPAVLLADDLVEAYQDGTYFPLYETDVPSNNIGLMINSIQDANIFKTKISYGYSIYKDGTNYYPLAYGTAIHQLRIPNDGIEHEIKVNMTLNRYVGFSLLMYGINEVIDITEDFKIDVNFDTVSADVIAQRDANTEYRLMSGIIKASTSAIGMLKGSYTESSGGYMESTSFDMRSAAKGVENTLIGMQNVVYAVTPKFNTYTENSYPAGDLINTYYGLMAYVGEVENLIEVNNKKEKYGYIVDYDISSKSNFYTYLNDGRNFVKFSEFEIEGSLPSQFKEAIQSIFLRGTFFNY